MITKETIGVRYRGQKEKRCDKKKYIYTSNGLWTSEKDNTIRRIKIWSELIYKVFFKIIN